MCVFQQVGVHFVTRSGRRARALDQWELGTIRDYTHRFMFLGNDKLSTWPDGIFPTTGRHARGDTRVANHIYLTLHWKNSRLALSVCID